MQRVLLSIFAAALLAGCQVQDPFAAFGPRRVPSPTTAQTAPYYPPSASASKQAPAPTTAPSPRISVSAENNPPLPTDRARFVADSADREPIRIVENPSATRTASAANRLTPSTAPAPSQLPTPPPTQPKVPASGKSPPQSGIFRADPAVVPATYKQASPAFNEPASAEGQWRAR